MDVSTLGASKAYTNLVALGLTSISVSGTTVTFTLTDGSSASVTVPTPANGASIVDVEIDAVTKHLICTLSNGTEIDAGEVPSGGGGGGTFTGKSDIAIGGIAKNQVFTEADLQEMMASLLTVYTKPSISLSLSPNTVLYEIGSVVSSVTLIATAVKNSEAITKIEFYDGATLLNTVTTGVSNGGTFSFNVTTPFSTNKTFKVKVTDATNQSSIAEKTITFVSASYYGILDSATITEAIVKGLTKKLSTTKAFKWTGITMNNKRCCYAYPSSIGGQLTKIIDSNGFNVTSAYTRQDLMIDGVAYFVYYLTDTGSLNNGSMDFS